MNTGINNLRVNIQEWSNRIVKSESDQFGYKLKYFLDKITENPLTFSMLEEAKELYPIDDESLSKLLKVMPNWYEAISVENETHHAVIAYKLMMYLLEKKEGNHQHLIYFHFGGNNNKVSKFVEVFITPIVNHLNDRLDGSNSTLYLLSKYKKRVEWFTKEVLLEKYKSASKNFEQILEDDLRLFLFDQGIEYPFSTPKSPSGRADVVGDLESNDPLVLEIKIIDKEKQYGINRLQSGVSQILQYVKDYHKSIGYLVVFNLDQTEFEYSLDNDWKIPKLQIGDKTIFIITVNLQDIESASKQGKLKTIKIERSNLIN